MSKIFCKIRSFFKTIDNKVLKDSCTEEKETIVGGLVTLNKPNNIRITYWKKDEHKLKFQVDGSDINLKIGSLPESLGTGRIIIKMYATNSSVIIDDNCWVSQHLTIILGQKHPNFGLISDTHLFIGESCSFEGCSIVSFNSNCKISIGKRSMVSFGVTIYNTDSHPIYDSETGLILNKVKDLSIGSHCWIGANATILKNVTLPDNTIVGWGAVVTTSSLKDGENKIRNQNSGVILSGNPARIARSGVRWSSNGSNGYVQNSRDDNLNVK